MPHLPCLFSPFQLGNKRLKNRIIMAPMTRNFADVDGLKPTHAMRDYYAARKGLGMIITEGTIIRPDTTAYRAVPGIYSETQMEAWKAITTAVHEDGGIIYSQLWDLGRASHPYYTNGATPISASATSMSGKVRRSEDLGITYVQARAATLEDIEKIKQDYIRAAKNAMRAGFDGVELHAANGYLLDQFKHVLTNLRDKDDPYGGTPEKMARLTLEIVHALGEAIGFDNVGIRLSPGGYLNDITGDQRDADVFKYLLEQLNELPISYVHTGNFDDTKTFAELGNLTMTAFMRQYYRGTLIACGCYTPETAEVHISNNACDLVAFGRPIIANPEFVKMLAEEASLRPYEVGMLTTLK